MSPNSEGGIHGRGWEYALCHYGQIDLGATFFLLSNERQGHYYPKTAEA
jgi:hypothetical protein